MIKNKMKKIRVIQHSTFNIQRPTSKGVDGGVHWLFDVGCWMLNVSRSRVGIGLIILLAGSVCTFAQSNGVPGPDEYARFSHFITDRNIFDPSRQPHNYDSSHVFRPNRVRTPRGTPAVQFVGTMSYEKGLFAFFSGNSMDLSQILRVGDKLQNYTITDITATNVMMESADKKEQLELEIGDGLRQESDKWIFSKAGELPAEASPTAPSSSPSSSGGDSSGSTPAALPPALEGNDVLKRLMEKRAKENQ
jgi:hypothetical protein